MAALEVIAETGQGDIKALQGDQAGRARLRVGDYRVIFQRQGDRLVILVLQVGNRREVYRTDPPAIAPPKPTKVRFGGLIAFPQLSSSAIVHLQPGKKSGSPPLG